MVTDEGQRHECVQAFFNILRPGGRVVIDERNFRYILEHAQYIESNPFAFPSIEGDVMYSGIVRGYPLHISEDSVGWNLFDSSTVRNREVAKTDIIGPSELQLYPLAFGELFGLLEAAGFIDIDVRTDLDLTSSGARPNYSRVDSSESSA
jgi:hypothetical protein